MSEQKIYKAMVAIMSDIGAIEKREKNTHQRFDFRGIDTVYNGLHDVMAKHGVFSVPEVIEEKSEDRTSSNGKPLIYRVLHIQYTFYADDGSHVVAKVIGEGMDSGDKAANKAMAVAHKYALLQAFCVPTRETKDPDAESHEVAARGQQPSRPRDEPRNEQAPEERRETQEGASRSGPVYRFGKYKTEGLGSGSEEAIEWYRGAIAKGIDDPEKERFRDDAILHLREVDAEIKRRESEYKDAEPDPFGGDDVPF